MFHNEEKHFTKSRRFSKLLLSRNCIFLYTIFRTYVTLVSRKILPILRNNSRATIYDNKRIKEIRTRSWHRQVSTTFLLLSNYRYIYIRVHCLTANSYIYFAPLRNSPLPYVRTITLGNRD